MERRWAGRRAGWLQTVSRLCNAAAGPQVRQRQQQAFQTVTTAFPGNAQPLPGTNQPCLTRAPRLRRCPTGLAAAARPPESCLPLGQCARRGWLCPGVGPGCCQGPRRHSCRARRPYPQSLRLPAGQAGAVGERALVHGEVIMEVAMHSQCTAGCNALAQPPPRLAHGAAGGTAFLVRRMCMHKPRYAAWHGLS